MKQTQINKIEWKEVELGEIGQVVTGSTPPKNNMDNYGDKTPWIKPPNLDNSMYVCQSDEYLSDIGTQKSRLLPAGSVLVSCIGNIGKVAVSGCEVCTNQQINSIIPHQGISSEFLYYDIKKNQKKIESMANKAVVPILNKTQFSKIKIPLPFSNEKPDLKEQERIASILEKAEKQKEKSRKAEELLNEYLKSVFAEMFYGKGFEEVELGEITKIVSGSTPSTSKEEYWNGDINWIAPAELTDGHNYYYYETKKKITEKGLKSCSSNLFPPGTVMLTTRAPIGKVAIAGKEMCSNQGFKNFIPSEKINSEYLYFWFLLKKEYLNYLGVGATFKEISKSIVSKIKIPLPPIELQKKFAQIVEHVEKMKEHVRKTKQNAEELFDSLMSKAFRGEL